MLGGDIQRPLTLAISIATFAAVLVGAAATLGRVHGLQDSLDLMNKANEELRNIIKDLAERLRKKD
jgi:hypothetical protein